MQMLHSADERILLLDKNVYLINFPTGFISIVLSHELILWLNSANSNLKNFRALLSSSSFKIPETSTIQQALSQIVPSPVKQSYLLSRQSVIAHTLKLKFTNLQIHPHNPKKVQHYFISLEFLWSCYIPFSKSTLERQFTAGLVRVP